MLRKMYHTQEMRGVVLPEPIKCTRDDAWLGDAYYYWLSLDDADNWGVKSKRSTGWYEIYESDIDFNNVLNTVFNEEHYFFWLEVIEKVAKSIIRKTHLKPTLKELNTYLKSRGDWDEVAGILFQDLPSSDYYSLVKPMKYAEKTVYFAYKKRIQLALYDKQNVLTFALLLQKECY